MTQLSYSTAKDTPVTHGPHKGKLTGAKQRCQMSGCTGLRLTVKWEDDAITHPCSKGMLWTDKGWVIP